MCDTIRDYLESLKKHLKACDPALIQDALSDAEEYLWSALAEVKAQEPGRADHAALMTVVDRFGSPAEIASAYRDHESRIQPTWFPAPAQSKKSSAASFFRILKDSRAWGAFLYFLLAGLTGCLYGLWAFFGLTFSLISLIFILGIPLTGVFLLSLRGIALIEGRIVEALLGSRMPRKPLFMKNNLGWKDKFKALAGESLTWKILIYLLTQFPLGLFAFLVTTTLAAVSLKCILYPFWFWILRRPLIDFSTNAPFFPPVWSIPLVVLAGIICLFSTLHALKALGKIQGRWAKKMLVRRTEA